MNIDWSKSIKKASITLAQVIVGAILGFGFTQQALTLLHLTPTPEQITQIQLAVAGAIGGGLELLRNVIKMKTGWKWL